METCTYDETHWTSRKRRQSCCMECCSQWSHLWPSCLPMTWSRASSPMSLVHTGGWNFFLTISHHWRLCHKTVEAKPVCFVFRLNFLETASGLKFVLNTDTESSQTEIRELVSKWQLRFLRNIFSFHRSGAFMLLCTLSMPPRIPCLCLGRWSPVTSSEQRF